MKACFDRKLIEIIFKDELNTSSKAESTNTRHLKKYRDRIVKEIEDIKQKEFDQVVSSLNLSLMSQLKYNFRNSEKKKPN